MDKNQTGIGNFDWWEDEEELTQEVEPRKAWKFGKRDNNNEDGQSNP